MTDFRALQDRLGQWDGRRRQVALLLWLPRALAAATIGRKMSISKFEGIPWSAAAMRTTLAATVTTFAGMLFITFGTPMLAGMAAVLGSTLSGTWLSGPLVESLAFYSGLTAAATNLPATLILSETIYLQEDALFGFSQPLGTGSIWLFSPWLLFILLHTLAAVALYVWTVRRVRRVSDV